MPPLSPNQATRRHPGHADREDSELAAAARADASAFAELYHRYVERVYRFLYHRLPSDEDAEDLTAQVFLEALELLDRYREQGSFAAWLFTIARRKAIAHYRKQRPMAPLAEARLSKLDHPQDDPLEEIAAADSQARLAQLLRQLREDEREVLALRFGATLTYREIGSILGKSEGAVKMTIHRLLDRLRARWESET